MSDYDERLELAAVAVSSLGRQLDELKAQIEQFRIEAEKQREAVKELKADFAAKKDETKAQVLAALEESTEDICRQLGERMSRDIMETAAKRKEEQ